MADASNIAPAELEVLRFVMDAQPVSVRDVADAMQKRRGLARTTVQTLLERLRKKGHVRRRMANGVFQYSLQVPKRRLMQQLVSEFVDHSLGGSISPFIAYLTNRAKLTAEQIEELEQMAAQIPDPTAKPRKKG